MLQVCFTKQERELKDLTDAEEKRKQQALWLLRLKSNLCQLNSQLESQGHDLDRLFKKELVARK